MTKTTRRMARQPFDSSVVVAPPSGTTAEASPAPAPVKSKISVVVSLLQREEGATLEEIAAATGWLKHTIRAALTGLKKKGHAIEKSKRDDVTCYCITSKA